MKRKQEEEKEETKKEEGLEPETKRQKKDGDE